MKNVLRPPCGIALFFTTLGLTAGVICANAGRVDEPVTVDKIFSVWEARQKHANDVVFQWTEKRTYAKGSLPGPLESTMGRVGKTEATPSNDVVHENRLTLNLSGDLLRFTNAGPKWMPDHRKFVFRTYTNVFDGQDDKDFNTEADDETHGALLHRFGFVRKTVGHSEDVVDYHIWPVLFAFRPTHSHMGKFQRGQWRTMAEKVAVEGRDCVVLSKSQGRLTETCWVDVERDSAILRHDSAVDGRVYVRVQIRHKQDDSHGWIPSEWHIVKSDSSTGKLDQDVTARVTDYRIGVPLADATFQLNFPQGTYVVNDKTKTNYIVKKDGSQRIITNDEQMRGASYEQLVATESGMAGLESKKTWWSRLWMPLAGLVFAAVVVALVLRRRFRGIRTASL